MSGWWEAEFKGRRGIIPRTFVTDYIPVPVPIPVPVSASAPVSTPVTTPVFVPVSVPVTTLVTSPAKKQEERKAMVEFNGNKTVLQVPCGSLPDLMSSIREQLSIVTPFALNVHDADFDDFVELKDISALSGCSRRRTG